MASVNSEIFPKFKTAVKLSTRQDGDGNEIEVRLFNKLVKRLFCDVHYECYRWKYGKMKNNRLNYRKSSIFWWLQVILELE